MKKFLLVFIFLLNFGSAFCQTNVYHPFPDSNAVWSVNLDKILIKGDSLYNLKIYKKYYRTSDTNLTASSLQYFAMVRQDVATKKVYGVGPGATVERLIYDFTLNVNDTVTVYPIEWCTYDSPYKQKITAKDSILINGSYRQRFYLQGYYNLARDTVIEGLGSYCGPLAIGLNAFCATDVCVPVLLCQKQDSVLMFQNPVYNSCYYIPCVMDVKTVSNVETSVYPNPVSSILHIAAVGNCKLLTIVGEELLESGSGQMDVSTLPNGIYFLKVTDGEKSFSKKVVIQH